MALQESADLLVEVGTEELPPTALRRLMDSFADGVADGLEKAHLGHGTVRALASPRRLAVLIPGLELKQADREVLQKGPPLRIAFDETGKPTQAGLAFAKKCGVDITALGKDRGTAGEWLIYESTQRGKEAADLLPGIVEQALDALPIPRRMRWGSSQAAFVRPVHWLVMLHGKKVIDCSILGVRAGNRTRGHRFHAPGEIEIASPGDYLSLLKKKGYVVADFDERKAAIVKGVQAAAADFAGSPVGDDALYDEVAALTEWPVPLRGGFDKAFLALPKAVINATLMNHQRYFPIEDDSGQLLPGFVTVANLESRAPDLVRQGNERVVRPRLADAMFFFETDRRMPLADRLPALDSVVYQKGLGTLGDKARRVASLAQSLTTAAAADADAVERAASLAKCDLLTGMVGEFPELQGVMGGLYAVADGEAPAVAAAVTDQYAPRFAGDEIPTGSEGRVLAVADKLDTLAGVFAMGKKPGGKRDPFGLRRAALGVVRILIEGGIDIRLGDLLRDAVALQPLQIDVDAVTADLLAFIGERLKHYLLDLDPELTADMLAAVQSQDPDTLLDLMARVQGVKAFMAMDAAESLAAANKRTANILRKAVPELAAVDSDLFAEPAELALHDAMLKARGNALPLFEKRAYVEALTLLAELREPIDTFFDEVMVMADDEAVRANRLALLAELRSLFLGVADVSRLSASQD